MHMTHKLLAQQIKRATGKTGSLDVDHLLKLVGDAYGEIDADQTRTEREIAVMIDALEKAHAELAENQEQRFKAAIGYMRQGLSTFDADHNLLVCNQAYLDFYQLSPDIAKPGTSFWTLLDHAAKRGFVTIADPVERRAVLSKVISDGKPWRGPIELVNGQVAHFCHQPLPGGGWLTTQEDITEQQKLENEKAEVTRENERQHMRFSAAVNHMSQGLCMYDCEQHLVTCNESFARMYKIPAKLRRPGTWHWDVHAYLERSGIFADSDRIAERQSLEELIKDGQPNRRAVKLANGRVVMINHQPMADGGWLATHEDITEQHHSEEMIRFLAHFDGLTGLANRANFLDAMAEAEQKIAQGAIMAVLCIDLDHFKEINDNFGHSVGDDILKKAANRIHSCLGSGGVAARLGGDEFSALIGPLDSFEAASRIAATIIEAFAAPIETSNFTIQVGASVGVAAAPHDGIDTDTLMRNADLALYAAKRDQRGGFCFFEAEMDAARRRRQALENGLRLAVRDGLFELYYQPIVSLTDNRVSVCEALMRWRSPELGFVSPAEFIPVAEETGLIREMGVWALNSACAEAAKWPSDVGLAVNVSPVQFKGEALVGQVQAALKSSGLEPGRLELEITESLFLADDQHNLKILHGLRQLGVRLALDDFGTGYSSLGYLLRFPFDKIKIDRSIVSSVAENAGTVAMMKAIVDLCDSFGMTSVAEGIETEAQLEGVRNLGCSQMQGYLFSPPLPQSAIGEMVRIGGGQKGTTSASLVAVS